MVSKGQRWLGAIPLFVLAVTALLVAQRSGNDVLTGSRAFGDWHNDEPGVRRRLTPQDLPAPTLTPSATNFPETVAVPAGSKPRVPPGFEVEILASGLDGPRVIRIAPNGDLFVAESRANRVRAFRMNPGSTNPSTSETFASGLNQPYGIAFYPPGPSPQWVYVGNSDGLVRFAYHNGDLKAAAKPERIVDHIPWTHHWTRDVAVSPDGKRIFYSVGSGSNVALDMFPKPLDQPLEIFAQTHPLGAAWDTEDKRAAVWSFDPDGGNAQVVATGLRNCAGMALQRGTGGLWCVVNERDELGDNTPFEYATEVEEGAFYGWPWYYIGAHEDPRQRGARPDLKDHITLPSVLIQAHSAPLQIAFYDADMFPAAYKGSAFVTLHGSWNRGRRTGYKVVRLTFADGKPTGEYVDFMTGFVIDEQHVWGRPAGVAVAVDGSLLVSDDVSGTIWRVSHSHSDSESAAVPH